MNTNAWFSRSHNTSKYGETLFFFVNLLSTAIIFQCVISQSKLVMGFPLIHGGLWTKMGNEWCWHAWIGHHILIPLWLKALASNQWMQSPKGLYQWTMGFNCVRLSWPTFLFSDDSLGAVTVRQSFQNLGLSQALAGIQSNNPSIIDLPIQKAFQVRCLRCPLKVSHAWYIYFKINITCMMYFNS